MMFGHKCSMYPDQQAKINHPRQRAARRALRALRKRQLDAPKLDGYTRPGSTNRHKSTPTSPRRRTTRKH